MCLCCCVGENLAKIVNEAEKLVFQTLFFFSELGEQFSSKQEVWGLYSVTGFQIIGLFQI